MNPKRAHELEGSRLALSKAVHSDLGWFMSRRRSGWSLSARVLKLAGHQAGMPLAYRSAPLVIDNDGKSDINLLAMEIRGMDQIRTPVARFASAFRSRRMPVAGEVGAAIIACYQRHCTKERVAKS